MNEEKMADTAIVVADTIEAGLEGIPAPVWLMGLSLVLGRFGAKGAASPEAFDELLSIFSAAAREVYDGGRERFDA